MRLIQRRMTVLLCSVAVAAFATAALARPIHYHRHRAAGVERTATASQATRPDRDMRFSFNAAQTASGAARRSRHHTRYSRAARDPRLGTDANARFIAAQSHANSAYGGATSNDLVSEARKYIGSNPTGRRSLWCGAFMDMVLRETGHKGGGNLASAYAHYGRRISGPEVGAIAVMGRRGGGHVGVVSGIDANGNPIIVSGNHNHTVAESVYPRGRIAAYVLPGG